MPPPSAESTRALMRIARAVSDREPVAWETELERAPEMSATIGRLRLLQTLASVHDSTAGDAPTGSPAEPGARPRATDDLPRGLTTWGPLRILESLGRGGFGHVYRAYDSVLDREVALKLWRRGRGASRLIAEARALARVRHPSLPIVHGVDEHSSWLGMWTDLVHGRTLEELLATHGPVGAREAALVGVEVCRALAAVHRAGLVHRDVKTSNVMRDESGRIVLLDFGLAVDAIEGSVSGRAAGTPSSMAPELLRGERATAATDLYALGVLLYRLVTRAFPYEGHTLAEIDEQQRRGRRIALADRRPDLPVAFVRVVERALAEGSESREPSAEAMEQSLLDFLGSRTMDANPLEGARERSNRPHLPSFLTRFIGRHDEVSQCLGAIQANRLVTLLGPGGAGKTRLAIRVAETVAESQGVVAFADFSTLHEPEAVEPEVRRALGAGLPAGGEDLASMARAIGSASLLLVLDNCEHLLGASAGLATSLLAACPGVTILATSRSPLGIPGEQVIDVPPLSLPPAEAGATVEAVSAFDAIRLFVARARLVRPDFRLTDENAFAVAQVCRMADGLPLAIELAAARARALTPEEIRDHLSEGPRFLARGGFSSAARHQSLDAAIRWSYDSLPAEQRSLMDGLGVFAGTWTLLAASRVCADNAQELTVLDAVTSLIEQSLVSTAPPCLGVTRYRLLDTLRGFARERLRESGRLDEFEQRHFDHCLALAEEAEPLLWGPEQAAWSERLEADHANLQAALAWARERADRAADHLRLAGALARFWTERGHLTSGRQALTSALERPDAQGDPAAYARALLGASTLAIYQSDHEQAEAWGRRALELHRRQGDTVGIARTLVTLGIVAHEVSDYDRAEASYRESLELFRTLGDRRGEAHILNNLGAITWRQERWEDARRLLLDALSRAEPARDPGLRVLVLTNLGFVGNHLGRTQEAATCLAEALGLVQENRLLRHAASALEAAAALLANQHESARAVRLYAAADQHRHELGHHQEPAWRRAHQPTVEAATRDLGPERLESESQVGRGLSLAKAIEEARRGLELVV